MSNPAEGFERALDRVLNRLTHPVALTLVTLIVIVAGLVPTLWPYAVLPRDTKLLQAAGRLDLVASLAARETEALAAGRPLSAEHLSRAVAALPGVALDRGRSIHLADEQGNLVASEPATLRPVRRLSELFGETPPRRIDAGSGAMQTTLRDGTPVLATVRSIGSGHLVMVQPKEDILEGEHPFAHSVLPIVVFGGLAGLCALSLASARRARSLDLTFGRLQSRLDASLTRGGCGLWDWDVARGRISWSTSMYELLGFEPRGGHLSPCEVEAIMHLPEGSLSQLVEEVGSGGRRFIEHDLQARNAAGEWRWLSTKAELVLDPYDGTRHVVGVAVDVTEARGLAARRESDDIRLREAVEALSEAFVLWDAEDRLILCNSKFRDLHQLPPELAVPGTRYSQIARAAARPLTETPLTGARPNEPDTRTIETQLPNGRWLHVNERRTRDGGVVSVGTDVSSLKRSEARLKATERRLKGSVRAAETRAQRFAALAERNYEANLAKTEFLARMSHELRTPLNHIIGFAEIMRQEMFGPLGCSRYAEYSGDIHESGLRLLGVIDGILHMSRIESGRVTLSPELMTIDAPVESALALVAADAAAKGLGIETDIVAPSLLHGDTGALHEIFLQVLRNAVKFTEPGGLVRVRVRQADAHLNVYVEDNGVGIPSELLPRLGRPFAQAEAEYSRARGGTGLGLAIARSLTEMHGGRLRIRSETGLGTVVLVHLPMVQPPANDAAALPRLRTAVQLAAAE